ncbi:MAG: hypothetical protein RLY31_3224 [Bacteroidota bacterium]|jgi:hypothetical protein
MGGTAALKARVEIHFSTEPRMKQRLQTLIPPAGWFPLAMAACLLASCGEGPVARERLVSTEHLDSLFVELDEVEGLEIASVWRNSRAPDYNRSGDPERGFTCAEDAALALVFYCRQHERAPSADSRKRIGSLSRFLWHQQADNGYFHNYVWSGTVINRSHPDSRAEPASWSWRTLWALSEVLALQDPALSDLQQTIKASADKLIWALRRYCPAAEEGSATDCLSETDVRQAGLLLSGLTNYYRTYPARSVRRLMEQWAERLVRTAEPDAVEPRQNALREHAERWVAEGTVQADALIRAGLALQRSGWIEAGRREVDQFYPMLTDMEGTGGFQDKQAPWGTPTVTIDTFPQKSAGIGPMVEAALSAFEATGDTSYAVLGGRLATWFLGNNPAGEVMYDRTTGRGYEAIEAPRQVNRDAGAASTLAALLALQAVEACPPALRSMEDARRPAIAR